MSRILHWHPEMEHLGGCVVAMGVFDGVHIGHQALVHDAVELARSRGVCSVVLTFDRDPDQIVNPATAMPQLLDLDDKLNLLARQGADVVLVVPFTERLAATAPLVFLDEVLLQTMAPVAVTVGYDFRFGHRAEGDVDVLVRYGAVHGFTVLAHELVNDAGAPVTSTRIRRLVESGEVSEAGRLLGRPHRVRGLVVRGRGEGAELDAPTANLATAPFAALPADGVYAGRTEVDGVTYACAVSVGVPPSFPDATAELEAHLIGFRGDLYGRSLVIEFISRIRPQRRFDDQAELAAAIRADIEQVRHLAGP
ncbi:MAG TPA: riboflavin biosynthesis protein RibF [Coriobacteriia bacterium]